MVKIIKIITLVLILLFSTNLFADKTDLSIVSYNVYFNNNTGKKRYPQIINYLNKKNADIIALQEVTNTFYTLISNSVLSKKYNITTQKPKGRYFNIILSKIKPNNSKTIPFVSNMGRSALYIDFKYKKSTIRIINVHLESLNSAISQKLRTQQLKDLKKLFTSKTILLGDFNFSKKGDLYNSKISNLIDASSTSSQKDTPTYDIKNNFIASSTADNNEKSRRLDRFYISPSFKISKYEVLKVLYSDHYPVIVKFSPPAP